MAAVDALPGFRRRILIEPHAGRVTAELEDDYHRMLVTIEHSGGVATAVTGAMARAPWTTCAGAERALARSFVGRRLTDFAGVGEWESNCTHLQDLALLAAAHAADANRLVIDILVSDLVDGIALAELRHNAAVTLRWRLAGRRIVAPTALAGRGLHELRDWIAGLGTKEREAARLLRWGVMLAGGRGMVIEKETRGLPQGKCYTFQPDRFAAAKRLGAIRDLSGLNEGPLADRPITPQAGGQRPGNEARPVTAEEVL